MVESLVSVEPMESQLPPEEISTGVPSSQPAIKGSSLDLGPRKNFFGKLMHPSGIMGGIVAGVLGFFVGGPVGAIIGLIAGVLGGGMISGNSPFDDKETATIAPGVNKIQVRLPEGEAPAMDMTLAATGRKRLKVTGRANESGQFEITESSVGFRGQPPERRTHTPPLHIPVDAQGYIDKKALYDALNQPVPSPAEAAQSLAPAKSAAAAHHKSAPKTPVKPARRAPHPGMQKALADFSAPDRLTPQAEPTMQDLGNLTHALPDLKQSGPDMGIG